MAIFLKRNLRSNPGWTRNRYQTRRALTMRNNSYQTDVVLRRADPDRSSHTRVTGRLTLPNPYAAQRGIHYQTGAQYLADVGFYRAARRKVARLRAPLFKKIGNKTFQIIKRKKPFPPFRKGFRGIYHNI